MKFAGGLRSHEEISSCSCEEIEGIPKVSSDPREGQKIYGKSSFDVPGKLQARPFSYVFASRAQYRLID